MKRFKRFLVTACDVLVLMGATGLILPPWTYGKNVLPPPVEGEEDNHPGQGDEHRADPCDHLPAPRGKAKGHDKKCPEGGSSGGVARGDFNGDGFGDLAIGVPFEDIGNVQDAGAVHVIYGSADGLTTTPTPQFFHQNSPSVGGVAESGDNFGSALAAGDFNDDGFSDLAIGVPNEDDDDGGTNFNGEDMGVVQVIYGTSTGLNPAPPTPTPPDQLWRYDTFVSGFAVDARFGFSLVWGDFNDDGFGDLAIGVPGASIPVCNVLTACATVRFSFDGGEVLVLYGKSQTEGLALLGHQFFHQNGQTDASENIGDSAEENDEFGRALTAGDFDGNGVDDLAVGVPFENLSLFASDEGLVHVIYGFRSNGLTRTGAMLFAQDTPGVLGVSESGDRFGAALAAGNFDGDNFADLAIGVPRENQEEANGTVRANIGSVNVLYGSDSGITTSGDQTWRQGFDIGILDVAEEGDQFGFSLAAGDFNNDGRSDLAIGVPFEDVANASGVLQNDAGAVHIIPGSESGLTNVGDQFFNQSNPTAPIRLAEAGDQFGFSLTAWNFGRSLQADLAIGIPGEDLFNASAVSLPNAGAVQVLYSATGGRLTYSDNQFWHQNPGFDSPNSDDVGDQAESGDQFGRALY